MINWNTLTSSAQLDEIDRLSHSQTILIFKHSTTCPISSMAKYRLEDQWKFGEEEEPLIYYLDLLSYRPLSSAIADRYSVHHESPQLLVIKKGECILESSHLGINLAEVEEVVG